MYNYSVYGLNIASELECPEFNPSYGEPELFIKYGDVPLSLASPKHSDENYEINENEFLFTAENVSFYVTKNQIIIHRIENVDYSHMRIHLYASVIGAFLLLNGHLPLHSSSIEINNKAILFAGDSGAGKSTLASVFSRKGYNIISDDVNVIRFKNNSIYTSVGIIHSKLWSDALSLVNETLDNLEKVSPNFDKYRIYNANRPNLSFYPVKCIYVIEKSNKEKIERKILQGGESFQELVNQTYRKLFLYGKKAYGKHVLNCAKLAGNLRVIKIYRPANKFTLPEIINIIENDFENNEQ